MKYPTKWISITCYFHQGKSLDFGYCSHKYQDIMAVDDGTVIRTETQKTGGNCIYIQHAGGIVSCYGHLDKIGVKKGQTVKLGQKIGTMGATGGVYNTKTKKYDPVAMHLHFGLYSKAKADRGFKINDKNSLYGDADLNPFDYLYVYPDQDASKVDVKYQAKLKYYKKEETWEKGKYRLKYAKYVRKSPKVNNNRYKVKELKTAAEDWSAKELKMLVSQKDNDYAQLKVGSELQIVKISKEGNNIWGKYGNYGNDWVCLCDITGPQADKILEL